MNANSFGSTHSGGISIRKDIRKHHPFWEDFRLPRDTPEESKGQNRRH
jgi:hypothetical protein